MRRLLIARKVYCEGLTPMPLAAVAKVERNLRYVADFELVAIAKALNVSSPRLPGDQSNNWLSFTFASGGTMEQYHGVGRLAAKAPTMRSYP
jgi:hypothetical protein